jgi:pimeloyl-ACP methyl ester carboxylesterase
MDVVLIPGFWLDATSWDGVLPALVEAGHSPTALTLPGLESKEADRRDIGFADQVAAVVAAVDALPGPVALVGHSGGGSIASAAADARADRVAHVIYVDSGPLGDGAAINEGLTAVNGEVPLPEWSEFDDSELTDLTDEQREQFRARAIPEPARVASDRVHLTDERRYGIRSTVISSTMPRELLEQLIAQGHPYVAEFGRMTRRAIIELPTGHWPQFTRPRELGAAIVTALAAAP